MSWHAVAKAIQNGKRHLGINEQIVSCHACKALLAIGATSHKAATEAANLIDRLNEIRKLKSDIYIIRFYVQSNAEN